MAVLTVDVPAPDDPVTAMMGNFSDMYPVPEKTQTTVFSALCTSKGSLMHRVMFDPAGCR
jgi:hypothetical protein